MRVCIVGLGGVGGYIAAHFAKAGIDVTGVARGDHLKAIQQNGLTIIDDIQKFTIPLHVSSLEELQGSFDVVLFCVKSYDLATTAQAMQKHITRDSILISFANGVNNGDILREKLNANIVDGCIYILSYLKAPGIIHKKGKVFAAVFSGKNDETLEKLFDQANLRYKKSENIQKELWKKYIFISAFATLTSYYDKTIYEVVTQYEEVAKETLQEIALVAQHKGIDIEKEVEKSLQIAKNLPKDASTSMHLDFQNNNKTELDSLTYYLIKEAKKYDLDLKNIEKMYNFLQQKEKN